MPRLLNVAQITAGHFRWRGRSLIRQAADRAKWKWPRAILL